MAYKNIEIDNKESVVNFLKDVSSRKEYSAFAKDSDTADVREIYGFNVDDNLPLYLPGLRLHRAQSFIRNFQNPNTPHKRLLVEWQTGIGKSIAVISIAQEFVRQYKLRETIGDIITPTVFVIGFTSRETIQEDMINYPEFGFISQAELMEIKRLRNLISINDDPNDAHKLALKTSLIRRRITDRSKNGYYSFYGYKEFANKLFLITKEGFNKNINIQDIYGTGMDENFDIKLEELIQKKYVSVNKTLLSSLRHSLLIADEIHNVYNIQEANNYGIAIQYALNKLGDEAPRCVFMSATPETGSASEVIDLLNLLVPLSELPGQKPLKRSDFFAKTSSRCADEDESEENFVVSQIKPDALDKISTYFAGRVSYLLDSETKSYPERIFVGESIPDVPYLKIIKCDMGKFQKDTIDSEERGVNRGFQSNAYALYDIAFPNPESEKIGLYKSSDVYEKLHNADIEWKAEAQISVSRDIIGGINTISGEFLHESNIGFYSAKYSRLLSELKNVMENKSGKIMIYHHRVRLSGVLLVQEILKMNGFVDEFTLPHDNTLCALCGIIRKLHKGDKHDYYPARFAVAHGEIDRNIMMSSIAKFNDISNLDGRYLKIILGSKIVKEGINFYAVQHQFILSIPIDYPTLIQVLGRAVRKNSHIDLPEEFRKVFVYILVSTEESAISPELQKYIDKGREYLVIQEVGRARHKNAIDGFANYSAINRAIKASQLNAIDYTPTQTSSMAKLDTFRAHGFFEKEIGLISNIVRVLFKARPIWTYGDLWTAVRKNYISNVQYDTSAFSEENYIMALDILKTPSGSPLSCLVARGRYYMMAIVGANGMPAIDIESYLRDRSQTPDDGIRIDISNYIKKTKTGRNFSIKLEDFESRYLSSDSNKIIDLSLIEFSGVFHYMLIRELILANGKKEISVDDKSVIDMYKRFRLTITCQDLKKANKLNEEFLGTYSMKSPIGYITPDSVTVFNPLLHEWYNLSHEELGIGKRIDENSVIIGYVVLTGDTLSNSVSSIKLRKPIHIIQKTFDVKKSDARTIERGSVCETLPREELYKLKSILKRKLMEFGIIEPITDYTKDMKIVKGGGIVESDENFTVTDFELDDLSEYQVNSVVLKNYIKKNKNASRMPSVAELCTFNILFLMAIEEYHRGLNPNSQRWLYLFNERPPNISSAIIKITR